jgi:hypothetical protein
MLNNQNSDAESRVYKLVVETITSLDVDIQVRLRKGTHLVKMHQNSGSQDPKLQLTNLVQKIESKEVYSQRMTLRNQEEREIKVELLLNSFLSALASKLDLINRNGKKNIQRFADFLMGLTCQKILDVSKSNFV